MRSIDVAQRRARLGARHHLATPCLDGIPTIAGDLVGLHSSDPATVYLSAWARSPSGFQPADLEGALYDDKELLRVLGMRMTMFVVPPDLAARLDVACATPISVAEVKRLARMLEQQGIADDGAAWIDRVSARVLSVLERRGPSTANEIKKEVPELENKLHFGEGKSWEGTVGVSTRILFLMAGQGRVVRARPLGSWISSQYRWAARDAWLAAPLPEIDQETAEHDLVHRWLRTFGPGTFTDIKWWTGWGVRKVRAALAAVAAVEVDLGEDTGFVAPEDVDRVTTPDPWAALLPSLDPTIMGWKDRDWYLSDHGSLLFDRNGNAGPTVWNDGRVVGGWAQRADGEVVFRLLEDVGSESAAAIEAAAGRLQEWLGDVRVVPRFPTSLQKELEG